MAAQSTTTTATTTEIARLSCTTSSLSSCSNPSDTLRTLPRKRRPRAVGEVYVTCPASRVYLNGEVNEHNEPLAEPIYQNEAAAVSQRYSYGQRRRAQLTVVASRIVERDDATKESMVVSTFVDDSDHYYETLSPLGNKRHSTELGVQRTPSQHHKRNQDLPRYLNGANGTRASKRQAKKYSLSAHALGEQVNLSDDSYDSFATDTDEHNETEERLKNHNDSGVDIHTIRLPDPPASQNQVYAIVRKFKDFISNKKSPKGAGSQQKLYENSTQFYVESSTLSQSGGNLYEKSHNRKKSQGSRKSQPEEIYQNTDYPKIPPTTPTTPTELAGKTLSSSEKNLVANEPATLTRIKQKNGKSLRSRLRKSLAGSSFDTKQMSNLMPTRSTFYIEDPGQLGGSGERELDSGFSEKASSGDIPVVSPSEVPSAESQKFSTVARKTKKEAKAQSALRRRTTIGIRPHDPPPPPPPTSAEDKLSKTTSWYAECGVFKQSTQIIQPGEGSKEGGVGGGGTTPTTPSSQMNGGLGGSWYAESGLYQTSGNSVASSSGSSGVSTGNEAGLGDELSPYSMFLNEPLYQIYNAAKLESTCNGDDIEDQEGSTDGYEEIGHHLKAKAAEEGSLLRAHDSQLRKSTRPSALQLVETRNKPSRTLWSEIPEVINSCILPTLTPRERGLQEAKFEIITSEASYLKSLNLLRQHFMNNPAFCDTSVLSAHDRKALFSYILPVHECSKHLLSELESCWQDNIMLLGLSRSIYAIAEREFKVYIAFCEHQGRMDRTLRRLKETKGGFQQQLEKLEANPSCCGLNLHSFLMLPMQRITRLPLLIDAVFSKVSPNDDEYDSWKMTLAIMNKIVAQCNEAANLCEQAYELERISKQLEFASHVRALAIAPVGVPKQGAKPRFLVKRGELTHLMWRGDEAKLTFGKRFSKISIYAFLFSDLLVLTKRKGESTFTVFDYCPRSLLTITSGDSLPQLPTKDLKDPNSKNLILMTLLENYEGKTVELVLSCPSVSDQQRWLQAMQPPEAETPGEKLYESWDCPQVTAIHSYESDEPDELQLQPGDVVNVSRKLPDGWYQGERIRDGAVGWFPGSFTTEVNSAHVRSRNLKQRYRLLTFTATFLEAQKKK